jgi:hypothetical protein
VDALTETKPAAGATGRPFRVLVTGSRTWDVPSRVERALGDSCLLAAEADCAQVVVVHGAAEAGADKFAASWARRAAASAVVIPGSPVRIRVRAEGHPADWRAYGPHAAGVIRNARMITLGADVCLAFVCPCYQVKCAGKPAHDSHGTADCVKRAEGAGIPVLRYPA